MNNQLTKLDNQAMSTPSQTEWQIMREQSNMLIKTGFLPQSIKTPEQAIAIMLQGRELGIPTMAALGTINVIQGKPTVSPQLMLALINRSGQLENLEIIIDPDGVTCKMKRKGRSVHSEYFGSKEATALGLISKDNYKKQALTMYRWRAVASCARVVFPDVVLGLYTPDEMGANTNEDGDYVFETNNIHSVTNIETKQIDSPSLPVDHKRAELEAEVYRLCRALNELNDSIIWKPKTTLNGYINDLFSIEDGLPNLDYESLETLIGDLNGRVATLSETPEIIQGEISE